MSSKLDDFLFKGKGQHGLTSLFLGKRHLEITIEPWEGDNTSSSFKFSDFKLLSMDSVDNSSEEFEFPWDLISIDEKEIRKNVWKFNIHCSCIDIIFVSRWPEKK